MKMIIHTLIEASRFATMTTERRDVDPDRKSFRQIRFSFRFFVDLEATSIHNATTNATRAPSSYVENLPAYRMKKERCRENGANRKKKLK